MKDHILQAHQRINQIVREATIRRVAEKWLESTMQKSMPALQVHEVEEEEEEQGAFLTQPLSLRPDYGKTAARLGFWHGTTYAKFSRRA